MFDQLRKAWQEAVDNFWYELRVGDDSASGNNDSPRQRLAHLRGKLESLEAKIDAESQEEARCRRLARQATDIGDRETSAIALHYAETHSVRLAELQRIYQRISIEYHQLLEQLVDG